MPREIRASEAIAVPSNRAAIQAIAVLFAVNVAAYLDRQILALLVGPIKASLGLSDGQVGLVQGLAFVTTFTGAGLVLGGLSDRLNRRNLLVLCVAVWSASTAAGSLANSGLQLFLGRMGVGLGEAALIPCAVSLLSDYTEARWRGRAYGLFTTGIYVGSGLALVFVAVAMPTMQGAAQVLTRMGHHGEPWRLVLASAAIPGLLCCGLLLMLREPARAAPPPRSAGLGLGDWIAGWRLYVPHHLALGFATFGLYAVSGWMPTALIRDHGLPPARVGLLFGGLVMISGIAGAYLGGMAADAGGRMAGDSGRLVAVTGAISVGFAGSLLLASPILAVASSGAALVLIGMGGAVVAGIVTLSSLCPARSRGQITAIYFLFTGIIGTAGAPAAVGYLSDATGKLGQAVAASCIATAACGVLFAVLALRRHRSAAGNEAP